jgi:hypothetical protein
MQALELPASILLIAVQKSGFHPNRFMQKGFIMKNIFCLILGLGIVASSLAAACSTKVSDALCGQIASIPDSSLVSIQICLPQPPFNYPSRGNIVQDSIYSVMVVDSVSRYLVSLKPRIDSLFEKYPLFSITTGQRLLATSAFSPIPYDYFMNVSTFASTISPLSKETLIGIVNTFTSTVPTAVTAIPDVAVLFTPFPFDTTFVGLYNMQQILPQTSTVAVARYGLNFILGQLATTVSVDNSIQIKEDFCLSNGTRLYSDIRYPRDTVPFDTSVLLQGKNYSSLCANCVPYVSLDSSYKTHEYRFQIGASVLYMEVLPGSKPDSIKVRFDTVSFLDKTIVSRAFSGHTIQSSFTLDKLKEIFEKGLNSVLSGKVKFYDLSGRNIQISTNAIQKKTRSGVVIVEYCENGSRIFMRYNLAK